jgi:hypothetical protein
MGDDENTNAAGHLDAAWRASRVDAIPPAPTYTAADLLRAYRLALADAEAMLKMLDDVDVLNAEDHLAAMPAPDAEALAARLEGE